MLGSYELYTLPASIELIMLAITTARPRFKATLFNNYEAGGRFFWRLKNYIEVLVLHI